MQMRENSRRNQGMSIAETNYRFISVILVMLCMMLFISAAANGQGWDFGDAPDPRYPTLLASDGARHEVNPRIFLGSGVDADPEGQHTMGATGDDNDGNDDEDGVSLPASLTPGNTANVTVMASVTGYLNAWVDFNGDGNWFGPGEQIFSDRSLFSGANSPSFGVPADAAPGSTYARFRFTSYPGNGMPPVGAQDDGEVEDYMVTIREVGDDVPPEMEMDFGDAPTPPFPTLLEDDGARHMVNPDIFLGSGVDAEINGHPSPDAQGDDSIGGDDEDGIIFTSALAQGSSVIVAVTASTGGLLNAWIDFNSNGHWGESDEHIAIDMPLSAGVNDVPIHIPMDASPELIFARFRFSTQPGLSYTGPAEDGEVEDYLLEIAEAAPGIDIEKSINGEDADEPPGPTLQAGEPVTWTYVVTNTGSVPLINIVVEDSEGVAVSCPRNELEVGESMTCTATGTAVEGQYANVGIAFGTLPSGEEVFDEDPSHYFGERSAMDFGDAPDTYRTLLASNGARHFIDPDVFLGMKLDAEEDGRPDAGAAGDDLNDDDDEDGVTFTSPLVKGLTANVTVIASTEGMLNAWMDFDGSGDWNMQDEHIFPNQPLGPGPNMLSFNIPMNAATGATFARFRFSHQHDLMFGGEAENGEVEDYAVEIDEANLDFGDAPDPRYPTLLANDGARHIIVSGVYLGNGVDADANGQPDSDSDGDDYDGNDDDDGIGGYWNLVPSETAHLSAEASAKGYLNAWVDFNNDGDWADADEQIFTDESLTTGSNALEFAVPTNTKIGYVYGRFRFSTQKGLSYDGVAKDGEVEDHVLLIVGSDYGDAPPPYPTLRTDNGARHISDSLLYMGSIIDTESNGLPNTDATGDDGDGSDDEDGVTFTSTLDPGKTASVDVVIPFHLVYTVYLNAWIDFNGNGDWADAGEQIFTDEAILSAGTYNLSFSIPAGAIPGLTFARFRLSSESGISYNGLARDGEVEDYQVTIQGPPTMDFGDAPDLTYPTLLRNDGARHVKDPDVYLGSGVDVESDGQPDSSAQGDDNAGIDDEDGIPLTSSLAQGSTNTFTVNASTDGLLNAWIDFNIDGDWEEPDEQIFIDHALVGGSNSLKIKIPLDAKLGTTFARFRFSTQGGLSFIGEASDGEVEDYVVEIDEAEMDFGDAPDPTYPTLLTNNGARHVVGSGVYLGSGVDADANGQPKSGSDGDDNDGNDDEDLYWYLVVPGFGGGLYPYASVDGYLNVWIDFNIDGDWDEPDEHLFKDEPLTVGNNSLILYIPESAKVGTTFARFRFSTQRGLSYDGLAEDGEVEDYQMVIYGVDYGDAPPQYPILKYDNGAGHFTEPNNGYYLGKTIDSELNGQPDSNATGDDNDGIDDEDGVTFTSTLMPGSKATVSVDNSMAVISTGPFVLNAWIDFNIDGDWADAGEQIIKDKTLTYAGTHSLSFNVPASASPGITFARFRSCSNGAGISYDGLLYDGEVEDYQVTIQGQATMDFGDAPDPTYPTLLRNDGARHVKDPDVYLGSGVDVESDGQPDSSAQGDDNTDIDDEDGIPLTSSLTQGSINTFTVNASTDGLLNAWIDFNADGDWEEPDEQIFTDYALVGGSNSLDIKIPEDAKPGTTFARFRFSTQGGLSFTGEAADGEVEDYVVEIDKAEMDFGDAPDPRYPTLRASDGARHIIDSGVYLGSYIDSESDGQPDSNSHGDDINGSDDEDGSGWTWQPAPGEINTAYVTASTEGYINAWIDLNDDGDWADANEQILTDKYVTTGANLMKFSLPEDAPIGFHYSRFRFSTTGGLSYTGLAQNGEVEDEQVYIEGLDFGDAPKPYPTLRSQNGARHVRSDLVYLGDKKSAEGVDIDADGQPEPDALGDDGDGNDDEDGVTFTSPLVPGNTASVKVEAPAGVGVVKGYLSAWIDFNGNGNWSDSGEQILTDKVITPGGNNVSFSVPSNASVGTTFARFRLDSETGISYDGFGHYGEVEDYQVTIQAKATMDFGDAPSPYPTLLADDGARHIVVTRTYLGSGVDVELTGKPDAGAQGDDNTDTDDEDGVSGMPSQLIPGDKPNVTVKASLNGFLNAWIDFNGDGDWADPEEQVFTDKAINFGANNLSFSVPAVAKSGATFARFRYNTKGGLSFTGMADDGEVEDYQVEIAEPQIDFGDAPNSYGTTLARGGARHTIVPGVYMGKSVDPETDGQPDATTQGDDNDGNDDEDGVIFTSRLLPGALASIELTVSVDGVLNGWIDFGKDGGFDMSDDYIFSQFVTSGTNKLAFAVPPSAVIGPTVARFRFVTSNIMVYYDGLVGGGEVEDYTVEIEQPGDMDFGDAPDMYLTTMTSNGARHQISPGIYLGSRVDADTDGQPDVDARGDDMGRSNDEDGVVFNTALIKGNTTHIAVTASVSGWLYAWVDFNIDGDWDDTDEEIFMAKLLSAGANNLKFDVPSDAVVGRTFARFRFIVTPFHTSYYGLSHDGEVEDYMVEIGEAGTVAVLPGDTNNDGRIRANDAILALRIAAGLMTSTDDQKKAADMNGDDRVRANDAILILRKAAGLAAPSTASVSNIGRSISIMLDEAERISGGRIRLLVKVDNVSMLAGGDISVAYDATSLRAIDVSSHPHMLMVSNTTEPGLVRIAFAGDGRLIGQTIAEVQFQMLADSTSPIELQNAELYGPDALPLISGHTDTKLWATPPKRSALLQNFPNPFNPETWLPYNLSEAADVTIRIHNVQGQLIRILYLDHRPAGFYLSRDDAAYWDGRNEAGEYISSGVYFYTLEAGDFRATRKLVISE